METGKTTTFSRRRYQAWIGNDGSEGKSRHQKSLPSSNIVQLVVSLVWGPNLHHRKVRIIRIKYGQFIIPSRYRSTTHHFSFGESLAHRLAASTRCWPWRHMSEWCCENFRSCGRPEEWVRRLSSDVELCLIAKSRSFWLMTAGIRCSGFDRWHPAVSYIPISLWTFFGSSSLALSASNSKNSNLTRTVPL